MRIRRIHLTTALLILACGLMGNARTGAQSGGDQIVDGIGETSLIARYILDGNAEDRSRDGRHATLHGSGATFIDDSQFGRALSLSGEKDTYMSLPGSALADAESVSVAGWVWLRSNAVGQMFFDFGRGSAAGLSCAFTGTNASDGPGGVRARISAGTTGGEQVVSAARISRDRWVHIAVVLDATAKSLSAYVDGAPSGKVRDLAVGLDQVLDYNNEDANKLRIGASQEGTSSLNAKVRDVRLYSVALSDDQVATIHRNGMASARVAAAGSDGPMRPIAAAAAVPPAAPVAAAKLTGVPDITATTTVGHLPKLPVMIPGTYENGVRGPQVRVIWPSPVNNSEVLRAGTYTVTGSVPGTAFAPKATVTVVAGDPSPAPARTLEAFALGQVLLNQDTRGQDTPFIRNRNKFVNTLVETNPDNFLYMFRDAFGQPQPQGARALGGWDTQTTRLRGHASGHYLSALAQAYASASYDPALQARFLEKMNYMIDTLHELSQKSGKPREAGGEFNADPTKVPPGPGRTGYDSNLTAQGIRTDCWNWGVGFISAYPPDQFIMLERGATYGGSNNQIWAPYYTLHKILAGLLDCYEVGGNQKALEVAKGMGSWVTQRLKVVPTETRIAMWNRYIAGEYGGMNEVMARLSRLTGDAQFLEGARLFDNISFFFGDAQRSHGLTHNVDTIRGKHANQHIPQITGALETYRDSRDPVYYRVADNFWDMTTTGYMYSIGGVAGARVPNNAECFTAQPNTLWQNGFAQGGQNETCATYNMLKLSRQLFMFKQDGKYMDYYEQALYNHILASVAENNAGNTYHVPLNPGARKSFGNANMSGFTCCNGTAIESSTKLQDSVYFRNADNAAVYVNLYVPSTLRWTEKNATIRQETSFPYADTTRLSLTGVNGLELNVRVPAWANRGFFVKVNGVDRAVAAAPGTYLSLGKEWRDGDTVELRMPLDFHLNRVMDSPTHASILYGPVVLAAEETASLPTYRAVTLNMADMSKSITGDPATLRFRIGEVALRPFYESYGRYSVYFEVRPE